MDFGSIPPRNQEHILQIDNCGTDFVVCSLLCKWLCDSWVCARTSTTHVETPALVPGRILLPSPSFHSRLKPECRMQTLWLKLVLITFMPPAHTSYLSAPLRGSNSETMPPMVPHRCSGRFHTPPTPLMPMVWCGVDLTMPPPWHQQFQLLQEIAWSFPSNRFGILISETTHAAMPALRRVPPCPYQTMEEGSVETLCVSQLSGAQPR